MSTPTKISARNPVCKLCGGCYESPYMLRIFSKAGLSQNLYSKLYKISGITISEDDNVFSAMLYNVGPHTPACCAFLCRTDSDLQVQNYKNEVQLKLKLHQLWRIVVSVLQTNLISCRVALCFVAFKRATLVSNLSCSLYWRERYCRELVSTSQIQLGRLQ